MNGLVKVSAKSRSTAVAGAIAGIVREYRRVVVQAIGAGAVNQAVKAIAIARKYLERDGLDITCVPSLVDVDIAGAERTAVKFVVEVSRTLPAEPTPASAPEPTPAPAVVDPAEGAPLMRGSLYEPRANVAPSSRGTDPALASETLTPGA